MNFLVDTNIWLERLLDQERSDDVKKFLDQVPNENLFLSDFTLHSIGVILFRNKKTNLFYQFVHDLFGNGKLGICSLNPFDLVELIELNTHLKLDFDDAYQAQVALKYDLALVTFDADFKKSGLKILSPKGAIVSYKKSS